MEDWNVTKYLIEHYPKFYDHVWKSGKIIVIVLRPGDTLFIPALYWHQVASFCRQIAVNIWFDYYSLKEQLKEEFVWHSRTCDIAAKIPSLSSRCHLG